MLSNREKEKHKIFVSIKGCLTIINLIIIVKKFQTSIETLHRGDKNANKKARMNLIHTSLFPLLMF
ncbi:hypothetical protein CHH80_16855 [Bacillus sp. 7504-2]|nr:hypothetical protein CHH80_16855 [Bacillus sp. 7504-2]